MSVIRRGYSVRNDLQHIFNEVNSVFGFSEFIAMCLVLYSEDKDFRNSLNFNLKKKVKEIKKKK